MEIIIFLVIASAVAYHLYNKKKSKHQNPTEPFVDPRSEEQKAKDAMEEMSKQTK